MDITELILFDPNMKELKKVALTINDNYVSDAKLMNRGGNINMLYNNYDEETATTAAYAIKIDEETLTVTDKILLARTSSKNQGGLLQPQYQLKLLGMFIRRIAAFFWLS